MPEDYQPKPRALWLAALIFGLVVIVDSWFRWSTFQYQTFDLAFYTQAFWLGLGAKTSILDVSLMGNHAEPICYLLLPFFWLWKHPMVFVVLQTVLLMTMPFTGYRIARRLEFERRGALWLGLATLLAPATGFMALHEFHPETLAAPLILLMLESRLSQRAGSFWVWFILALACKENVALMLAWLCAVHYLLDREKGREWQLAFNIVPGILAALWVALYAFWLGPLWNGGKVDYNELYGHLGGLGGMVKSPQNSLAAAWTAVRGGNLVWGLLLPFVFLPLLRPRWLIVAIPIFAQHLLSSRASEWTIHFHYAAPLVPLLWFATAEACARLYWRDVVAGWVLVACVAMQAWLGPVHLIWQTAKGNAVAREEARIRRELLEAIPDDASVVAGLPYLSHLAKREQVHSLHHVLKGLKTLSRAVYVPPAATDVVLFDAADGATLDRNAGYYHPIMKSVDEQIFPESEVLLDQFLTGNSWTVIARNEVTLLLKDKPKPAVAPIAGGRVLDESHLLLSAQFAPPPPNNIGLILLEWQIAPDRKLVPWMQLYLEGENGVQYVMTKGPVALGLPAQSRANESWILSPPRSIPPGKYRAQLVIYDNHQEQFPGRERFRMANFSLGELQIP